MYVRDGRGRCGLGLEGGPKAWGWNGVLWPARAELPAGAAAAGLLIGDAVGVG